jgi:molybdopterin synthase catalytic subunit
MKTHVQFTRQPIVPPRAVLASKEIGAQAEFLGIVRELENDREISGLFYEAYEPMAMKELEKIIADLSVRHTGEEIWFIHRLDFVPVGEASLFIRVQSRHRQAAFQIIAGLIDRLKADVPIWKRGPI